MMKNVEQINSMNLMIESKAIDFRDEDLCSYRLNIIDIILPAYTVLDGGNMESGGSGQTPLFRRIRFTELTDGIL